MGRVYTVEFENVSVSAAQDLFELDPGTDEPIEIMGWQFTQISDLGDSEEEVLRVKVIRGNATSGSGGTSATPAPIQNAAAASFSAEVNNTTEASTGTEVDLYSGGFNIRVGELMVLPEEFRFACNATQGLIVLRLMAAPADAITLSGTLWVKEHG